MNIPRHTGIIMDGNGRWAKLRGKKRSFGHRAGTKNVERVVEQAFNLGTKIVSLYAFSSENWKRPKEEVDALMDLLRQYFKSSANKFVKKGIRLTTMGDLTALPKDLQESIEALKERSKNATDKILNIGINYGSRAEIVNAVNSAIKDGKAITEEEISSRLYTAELGEPDLIIRTGGELRLSNFMLYQGAYAELYFTNCLWPDFNKEELEKAYEEYSHRKRRYGGIDEGETDGANGTK